MGIAALNPSYGLARDVQAEPRALLQVADHAEEVLGLRIAAWSEHADQALGRRAGRFAKLFKADGRLDVIAQDRLASINITAQHCIDAFAKKSLGKFLVGLDPTLHQFLEAFCFCHCPSPFNLARACPACSPASKHAPHRYRAAAASWFHRSAGR